MSSPFHQAHQSRMIKETELQLFGNLYFVFFIDKFRGNVRIRTIPEHEIKDIISDPEDSKNIWYYKREFNQKKFNARTGQYEMKTQIMYYKDWKNTEDRWKMINGKKIEKAVSSVI